MSSDTNIPPFISNGMFKQFKFPSSYLETLMSMYKVNNELTNSTQQIAMETTKEVMELQQKFLKKAFDQWNEQLKQNISKEPFKAESINPTEFAKEAFNQISEHAVEMSSVLSKSNEKLSASLKKHSKKVA